MPEETAGRVDGFLMGLEECGAWDWQVQQARKAVGLFLARAAGAVDRPPRGSGSGTLSPADLG
ncbi:MAG: hypothetical protein HY924_16505 [Elusimicrobia bacterium]|nr:hypothetical protein [Elusimicrobiota bacterium]